MILHMRKICIDIIVKLSYFTEPVYAQMKGESKKGQEGMI